MGFPPSNAFILICPAARGDSHLVLRCGVVRLPETSSRFGRVGDFTTGRVVKQAPATGRRGRNFKGRQLRLLSNFAYLFGAVQFARLAKSISTPINEIAFDSLVSQTASDMMAAEKLHAFESTRKDRTQPTERGRKETRITS